MTQELSQLGRYVLVERIASGGMADVYRAKLFGVEGFEKDVAIKRILPHWSGNRDFVDMLVDEAKVLLYLGHPNIVQVFELNRHENIYYLVMEFVEGVDLRHLLKLCKSQKKEVPLSLALYIIREICQGLEYAHQKKDKARNPMGIVHRDISPQNILLGFEGQVKVTDFGIAKVVGKTSETVTGTLKGKFAYMSPEQAMGAEIDHTTDIFATGILLYEMVTGERCFKGANDIQTLEAVRQAKISFSSEHLESLPQALVALIQKTLSQKSEDRPQSAKELGQSIRALEQELSLDGGSNELRLFIEQLMGDKLAEKREHDKDLSRKTRMFYQTVVAVSTAEISLAGGTKLLEGEDAIQTVMDQPSLFDEPATLVSPSLLPKSSQAIAVSALPNNPVPVLPSKPVAKLSKALLSGIGVGVILVALLVRWMFSTPAESVTPPPVLPVHEEPKEAVKNPPNLSTKMHTEEPVAPPLLDKPVDKPEVSPAPAMPPKTPDQKSSTTLTKTVEAPKKQGNGHISIIAHPWGLVSIQGVVSQSETPFSKTIPAGSYDIKVTYPPLQKTVFGHVVIQENGGAVCKAQFGQTAGLSCQ